MLYKKGTREHAHTRALVCVHAHTLTHFQPPYPRALLLSPFKVLATPAFHSLAAGSTVLTFQRASTLLNPHAGADSLHPL